MKKPCLLFITGCLLLSPATLAQDSSIEPEQGKDETSSKASEDFSPRGRQKPKPKGDEIEDQQPENSGGGFGGPFGSGGGGFGGGGFGGGNMGMGGGLGYGNNSMNRMVSAENVIIAWSKEKDQLRGFSLSNGTWTILQVPQQEQIVPVVTSNVAAVKLKDGMAAFSAQKQKWAILPLPKDSKAPPVVSNDLVTVYEGDHIYTFAANSGRWTSPTDDKLQMMSKAIPTFPKGMDSRSIDAELKRLNLSLVTTGKGQAISGAAADIAQFESFLARSTSSKMGLPQPAGTTGFSFPDSVQNQPSPARSPSESNGLTQPGQTLGTFVPSGSGMPLSSRPLPDPGSGLSGNRFEAPSPNRRPQLPGTFPSYPSQANRLQLYRPNTPAAKAEKASLKLAETLRDKQQKRELTDAEKAELHNLVASALVERLTAQQKSVDELRKKLKAVEAKLKNKLDNKQKMIDRRVDELLNPDLDWNSVSTKGTASPLTTSFFSKTKSREQFSTGPARIQTYTQPGSTTDNFFSFSRENKPSTFEFPSNTLRAPEASPRLVPTAKLDDFMGWDPRTGRIANELAGQAGKLRKEASDLQREVQATSQQLRVNSESRSREQESLEKLNRAFKGTTLEIVHRKSAIQNIKIMDNSIAEQRRRYDDQLSDWKRVWKQIASATESQKARVEIAQAIAERCEKEVKTKQGLADRGLVPTSEVESAMIKKKLADLQLKEHQRTLEEFQQIVTENPELNPASFEDATEPHSSSVELDPGEE